MCIARPLSRFAGMVVGCGDQVNPLLPRGMVQFEIVILNERFLRSEEPALSEAEGIWASRA
jgi:hypothetical protein